MSTGRCVPVFVSRLHDADSRSQCPARRPSLVSSLTSKAIRVPPLGSGRTDEPTLARRKIRLRPGSVSMESRAAFLRGQGGCHQGERKRPPGSPMLPQARTRLFALAVSAPVGKLGLLRLPERQRPVADSLVPNVLSGSLLRACSLGSGQRFFVERGAPPTSSEIRLSSSSWGSSGRRARRLRSCTDDKGTNACKRRGDSER